MNRSTFNFNRIAKNIVLAVTLGAGLVGQTANVAQKNSGSLNGTATSALMAAAPVAATTAFTPNYAARAIAVRHWNKKVLTVHVTASANDDKTPSEVAAAIADSAAIWNGKVGETVTLKLVESTEADIDITFVAPGTLRGGAIGLTDIRFHCDDQSIGYAAIRVNEKLSKAELVQVVAHEMGHALGIQGHSDDKNDLMYPFAHLPAQITDRDMNTFHVGYNVAANALTSASVE